MPAPHKGEPLNKFISRFVKNKGETKKIPDVKQRLAVGYAEAKRAASKR